MTDNVATKNNQPHKKTQQQFESELFEINKNLLVLGKYKNSNTRIRCRCLIDGYEWEAWPLNLLRTHGCPVCSGRKVKKGVNDIATTNPEMLKFLTNIEDGHKYTANSHKKISFTCPDCHTTKIATIKNIHIQGFSCNLCGDGISYPNKFLRALLSQLSVRNLDFEYSPSWVKPRLYDAYFEYCDKSYIVEMDGDFHFKDNKMNKTTKEQVQAIDRYKDEAAKKHNIIVIRIPCRNISFDDLCDVVMTSPLNKIFDLSKVDFNQCGEYASSNLQKEICSFFNANKFKMSNLEIAEHFHISYSTFNKYLKDGKKLGWCDLTQDEEHLRRMIHSHNPRSYRISILDKNDNKLWEDLSVNACCAVLKTFYGINIGYDRVLRVISNNDQNAISEFKLISFGDAASSYSREI